MFREFSKALQLANGKTGPATCPRAVFTGTPESQRFCDPPMKRDWLLELDRAQTRRRFLSQLGASFSGLALTAMLAQDALAEQRWQTPSGLPVFAPKAKRVIWLFMRGGMSHME